MRPVAESCDSRGDVKLKRPRPSGPVDGTEIRRLLTQGRPTLVPVVRERILAVGNEAIPILIEVLHDDALAMDVGPGKGYSQILGARLLGELRAVEAIEPLLKQMVDTTWDDILHDTIMQSLPKIGAAVVEPALRLLAESEEPDVRQSVRAVLSDVGVRDDRIREALVAELEVEPDLGAMHLASYGDASVLPLLHAAFDRHPIVRGEVFANQALIELEAAIEDLGGALTPAQKDKVERGIKARRAERSEPDFDDNGDDMDVGMPVLGGEKRGRNEACCCGSRKKYKKCHLAADEEQRSPRSRIRTSSRRRWISTIERGEIGCHVAPERRERVGKIIQEFW